MSTKRIAARVVVATALIAGLVACAAIDEPATTQSTASAVQDNAPQWTSDGQLVLPTDYHEWVFLGSPLTPNALNDGQAGFPEYHNVYVQPAMFKAYRRTGEWPQGTIMLKELQLTRPGTNADGSSLEASGRGYFPGARNGIDISVRDDKRFPESQGWGFFNFGHHAPPYMETASAQPVSACAGCHISNATDMVFSKFYAPILDAK